MSFRSSSPVLDSARKRKKMLGTPPESSSKKQRGSQGTPTTPKQRQLSMDAFLVSRQSSPLSNISNSIRPRELIPKNFKPPQVVIRDDRDKEDEVAKPVAQVVAAQVATSQSSGKQRLCHNELVKAACLVVGGPYKQKKEEEDDVEIVMDSGVSRSAICEGYGLLFRKEIQDTHFKFALLLLASNLTPTQYPSAAILHSILQEIIPKSNSFDVKSMAFEILYEVLERHPPGLDEMRDMYWSVLPKKLANCDPSSRWENLRGHFESLERDFGTLEIADVSEENPSPFSVDEALLQFYITVLERDVHDWLEHHNEDHVVMMIEKKNVPMVAEIFWPYDEPLGALSKNVRELVTLHKNALVIRNEALLSVTSKLLGILVRVARVSETPYPVKVGSPGPKLRSLACGVSDIMYHGEELDDLSFLFATFDDSLFKLEMSKALLDIYEPGRGKLSTLQDILQTYLKLNEIKSPAELTSAFEKLSRNGQVCLAELVESYLNGFHVSRLWNFILKSRRTSGFEAAADADKYFSGSYSPADLVNDFRTLQSVVKLGKGSKIISNVFRM